MPWLKKYEKDRQTFFLSSTRWSTRLTLLCTLHERFELQRNRPSSPWKETQSQSLNPSMERLERGRGQQGRGSARASSCLRLLWRLLLHVWLFCSRLLQPNRKGRAKLLQNFQIPKAYSRPPLTLCPNMQYSSISVNFFLGDIIFH